MPDRYGEPPAEPPAETTGETTDEYPTRADLKAIHIRSCALCDDDGYRGRNVCDHQDHAAAAARGIEACRAALLATPAKFGNMYRLSDEDRGERNADPQRPHTVTNQSSVDMDNQTRNFNRQEGAQT